MTAVTPERLAAMFVEMADTLVDDFDLIEFLETVTQRTRELADVDAVGLLLADHHGQLRVMAASDERTKLVELFQLQHQEGPCLDAFATAQPVNCEDLDASGSRWPVFAPQATAAGFRSVRALPMRLRSTVIGALNLFAAEPGPIDGAEVSVVQALADVATIGLLQERAIRQGEVLTEQLQGALNSRVVIEQAKGALARMRGVSVDEAFTLMRMYAHTHGRRLTDVAEMVLHDPASVADLVSGITSGEVHNG